MTCPRLYMRVVQRRARMCYYFLWLFCFPVQHRRFTAKYLICLWMSCLRDLTNDSNNFLSGGSFLFSKHDSMILHSWPRSELLDNCSEIKAWNAFRWFFNYLAPNFSWVWFCRLITERHAPISMYLVPFVYIKLI